MAYQDTTASIYKDALSKGLKGYQRNKNSGASGHLTSLDGLLSHFPAVGHSELGTFEIPLSKIVGTYYHSRRKAFSKAFMPLESEHTEFAAKWINLYRAHIQEGIRDPIIVYEYLNYYYVVEGNKRVSVLKYVDAYGIYAKVTRILPQYDPENEEIVNYYSFVDFYRDTGLFQLWLSKPRRWERLKGYLDNYRPANIGESLKERAYHFYKEVYLPFRTEFYQFNGQVLPMTTGDALLLYLKLYGVPEFLDREALRELMPSLLRELGNYGDSEVLQIKTESSEMEKGSIINAVSSLIAPKKLKIGFVYARDPVSSGWTYAHDLGRAHVEEWFGNRIEVQTIDHVPEDASAYEVLLEFCERGFDAIFTTSEIFRHDTLKCALAYKNTHFFNCSGNRPYVHMTNYYGRAFETRFIEGVIAGLSTQTGVVGYTATAPSPEVYASVNAFILGLRMVKPNARLLLMYTGEWNNPQKTTAMAVAFMRYQADVVSNKTLNVPREVTKDYGVYSMLCKVDLSSGLPLAYLAAPIWRWEVFYEKIIGGLLNGAYDRLINNQGETEKPHHFWWGMDSGVIDVYVNETHLTPESKKLIQWMRSGIISGAVNPFEGPIYFDDGQLFVATGDILSAEEILAMDRFVMGVEVIEGE